MRGARGGEAGDGEEERAGEERGERQRKNEYFKERRKVAVLTWENMG